MIPKQLKGCRFNRVQFKEKRAFEKGWQNNPYSYEEIQKYFPKENFGVICGKEVRVLDDDTEKKGLIKIFIDNFGETFRVRDHLYFKFDNGNDKKIIFMNGKYHLGELQGEGTYVVGPGSLHPSGETYEVKKDLDIITISYEKFMEVFGEFIKNDNNTERKDVVFNSEDDSFIKNVKEKWDEGNRQELAMSVAGYLRKNKRLGLNSCLSIVEGIARDCNDSEIPQRLAAVRATFDKDEDRVKGISGLVEKEIKIEDFGELQKEVLQLVATRRDDEATEIIVKDILEKNNIYTTRDDVKSEIWVYETGIYKPNGATLIKEIVREFLGFAYTSQRANKVIAKIETDTGIDTDEFFNTKYVNEICVQNGILNLITREVSEFSPEKIFFNKLPVTYKKESKCPAIDKFFSEILTEKDDKNVLFELAGFALHKDYFIEKAFMFLGNGRNGKGKTLSLFKTFLGADNCCSVRLSQMEAQSSSLHELHNRLINLAGDLSSTSLKDTGLFKELTGRDLVQVKRKYLRDLIFTNHAKMVFACNELPRVYDLSEGFWSRWVLLDFPYKFLPKEEIENRTGQEKEFCKIQDPDIITKLTTPGELSGLLNEALDGLVRLKQTKDFSYSKGTAAIKDYWIRKSDSFTAFCLDTIEESSEGGLGSSYISKKNIRKAFQQYCKKYKLRGTSDNNIKAVLENMFGVIESRRSSSDFEKERVWEGIRFK